MVAGMQDKLTQSHTTLNGMFKELSASQTNITKGFEEVGERMESVDAVNKMLEDRSGTHTKLIQDLRILVDRLQQTKQDKSNFQEQRQQI